MFSNYLFLCTITVSAKYNDSVTAVPDSIKCRNIASDTVYHLRCFCITINILTIIRQVTNFHIYCHVCCKSTPASDNISVDHVADFKLPGSDNISGQLAAQRSWILQMWWHLHIYHRTKIVTTSESKCPNRTGTKYLFVEIVCPNNKILLMILCKSVSSTNKFIYFHVVSNIQIKSKCPSTDPCETPYFTYILFEFKFAKDANF